MPDSKYSMLDKLLHRMALQYVPIAEISFELDQKLSSGDKEKAKNGRHVFISGLARAGTTILMRALHETGCFRSLTYRDMPFVLAPNLWGKLSRFSRKEDDAIERAHGDNILVSADSPESLDEVFWRLFDGDSYIKADRLIPHTPSPAMIEKFRDYIAAILCSGIGGQRYLSKNNNNILRLSAITSAFPNAVVLIPFRDPMQHANSLMQQHLKFRESQRADPFVLSYMDWLGHHEFGAGHRRFNFGETTEPVLRTDAIDYWLCEWVETYRWLLENAPASAIFVCYEELCLDQSCWPRLLEIVDVVHRSNVEHPFRMSTRETPAGRNACLLEAANTVYGALREKSTLSLRKLK